MGLGSGTPEYSWKRGNVTLAFSNRLFEVFRVAPTGLLAKEKEGKTGQTNDANQPR